jgi:hypothetical protein
MTSLAFHPSCIVNLTAMKRPSNDWRRVPRQPKSMPGQKDLFDRGRDDEKKRGRKHKKGSKP